MKKIIIIMLVLMTVGIVCAYDAVAVAENNSGRLITVGIAFKDTNDYHFVTTIGGAANLLGWSGITYDIIAVVGDNIDIRIPGYYEIQKHTLEWWGSPNNIINFYFSHLDPVKPGDPGQNQ